MNYLNIFFFFSILGHLVENIFTTNYTSGILYGYWTPIYGVGIIIILLLNNFFKKKIKSKPLRYIFLFFSSFLLLCIIEYLSGYLIQQIFHKVFWNYKKHKFNIGLYTSLEMGLVWGVSSLIISIFIEPLCIKYSNKIPKFISYILLGLFILDILLTINNRVINF